MHARFLIAAACFAANLVPVFGRAGESSPAPVAFDGPEVFKVDWNSRGLTPCDLDGDGRLDLVLLNNDRARIDLLVQRDPGAEGADRRRGPAGGSNRLWKPVLEDARFVKRSLVTGIMTYALAAGDLDGDGRVDLAYTGSPDALTLRYQDDDDWQQSHVIRLGDPSQWTSSLIATDLDGDARCDLVLLTEGELIVLRQGKDGVMVEPLRMPLSERDCHGLMAVDLDRDGRLDLAYLSPGARPALYYRIQRPEGGLGPELRLPLETPRGRLEPIRRASAAGELGFAFIQDRTGLVEEIRIRPHTHAENPFELNPRISFLGGVGRDPAVYAIGDFNGDGRLDVAAGDGGGAVVRLFLQDTAGELQALAPFPSLSDLTALAAGDVDGDGADDLLQLSSREKSIGWSRYDARGRLEFPAPIPLTGQPLALAAADLDGDALLELVYVRELDRERQVAIMDRDAVGGIWQERSVSLTGLRTNPAAVEVMDLNQDGRPDLAVYTPQSPLRLLLQGEDGGFAEASLESGFHQGLVDRLDIAATSSCDLDGDGRGELLVAGEGFARALRFDSSGRLEVVDQFNADRSDRKIAAAVGVDLDADGGPEILLVEAGTGAVQILRAGAGGVYRHESTYEGGRIDLVDARVIDLDRNGRPDLLLLGRDRFWRVPVGDPALAVETMDSYESDLPDHEYTDLRAADLDGDGADEIITLDAASSRILEVLARGPDAGAWRSVYHFTVFEENPHYRGWRGSGSEPREFAVGDATGDGVADLLLLVHDRILLYPGL